MKAWAGLLILGLVVALAAWGEVRAKTQGIDGSPAALGGAESAAVTPPAEKAAGAKAAAKSAEAAKDPATAYKARQEAAAKTRDLARTRRTMTSTMRSRPGLDFQHTSVKDVLNYLAEVGRFSVVFDKSLEEAGIDLALRVIDIKVSGISYEKAIQLILPRECGYRVEAGYVLITTLEKSWMPLKTATYSVRLALAQIPNFTDAPRFEIGDVTQSAAAAAAGGGFGDLFGGGGTTTVDEGQVTPDRIVELIQKFVRNENDRRIAPWADEGGPATITYLGGQLIVTQSDAGHAAVRRIITMVE
ncbi:MAG TPA: hypothetical protein VM431_06685 [Phycisphaerae bacterium]|nr:hypothetical protein [Phycisphaerae bacterium]